MNEKKRFSTIVGVVTLLAVLVLIGLRQLAQWEIRRGQIKDTKATVDDMAFRFANKDMDAMMSWARGERLDAWGGPLVLADSDGYMVRIKSYGFDKLVDTKDDILSEVYYVIQPDYPDKEDDSFFDLKKEGRKWKFNFKWNWKKEPSDG